MKGLGLYHILERLDKLQKEVAATKRLVSRMAKLEETPDENKLDRQKIVALYVDEWRAKYKSSPALGGAEIGILSKLPLDHGLEKASMLLRAYFKMNDSFYIKKRHDPFTFKRDLQAIAHFSETHSVVTTEEAKEVERGSQYQMMMNQVRDGEL